MENHLIKLLLTVRKMLNLLENISNNSNELVGKTQPKVYLKHQVMEILQISESTYKRYVKSKKLDPEIVGTIHIYQEEDLKPLIAELKRKGRL